MTNPSRLNTLVTIVTNPQSAEALSLGISVTGELRIGTPIPTIQLVGHGGTGGNVYALSAGSSFPPGVSLIPGTPFLTGTPTGKGDYTFQCEVQDSSTTIARATFTLRVLGRMYAIYASPPPLVISPPPAGGTNYSYFFAVGGLVGAPSYSIVAGTVPPGLTMTATGANAGRLGIATTQTSVGTGGIHHFFTVRVTDLTTGEQLDIHTNMWIYSYTKGGWESAVTGGYPGGTSLPPCVQGVVTDYVFNVLDGTGLAPYSYALQSPAGLAADITLLPFNGTKSCRVRVNTLGGTGNYPIALTITDASNKSVITVSPVISVPPSGSASFCVIVPQNALQIQKSAVNVGSVGPFTVNFAGAGFASVAMVGDTVTVTINAGAGGVQGVTGSAPIVSSGGLNPIISHAVSGAGTGTFDRMTIDVYGHVTAGAFDYTTIFGKAVAASLNYDHSDFTGLTTLTDVVRLSGTAGGASAFRGFFPTPRTGQFVLLFNASTTTITLNNEDASESTAAARFAIGANFAIAAGHSAQLWYDTSSSRWRIAASY